MSKRLLPVLVLLLTAALAACGDDDGGQATDDGGTSTGGTGPQGSGPPADVTCDYPADQVPAAKKVDPPPSSPSVGGEVVATVDTPGLHVKLPFVQDVISFDRRLLNVELPGEEVILGDQRRLIVDSFSKVMDQAEALL